MMFHEKEFAYVSEYTVLQFYNNYWLCFTICINFFCSFSNLNVYNKLYVREDSILPQVRGAQLLLLGFLFLHENIIGLGHEKACSATENR